MKAAERYFLLFWTWKWAVLKLMGIQQFQFDHRAHPGYKLFSVHGSVRKKRVRPAQSQRHILLVLSPLDALEVNAILHHLPERTAKEKQHIVSEVLIGGNQHWLQCPEQ